MLIVSVSGAAPNEGQYIAAVFDSERSFMREPVAKRTVAVGANGQADISFQDLKPGNYAVTVIHDRDGNGTLNTNFLGAPEEPIVFSNVLRSRNGAPSFEEAAFLVERSDHQIALGLN